MTKKIERMWVYPEYKKKIKKEAAELGLSIVELTKKKTEEFPQLTYIRKNEKKKKKTFGFSF